MDSAQNNESTAYSGATEYRDALGDDKLEFVELETNDDFKTKICLPYFKDIYKDLQSRSDNPQKGINKVSLLDYASLPGVLGERFFHVMDADNDSYLDQREFLTGLFRLYCSSFDEKVEFIFEIYDFDGDGYITKNDISTVMASLPVINFKNLSREHEAEGKFSREGGGLDSFDQRVESLEDMNRILQICFEGKVKIDPVEFKRINEDISSDTVLAVLNLFRERLPCSENFWRYKRNYDLHVKVSQNQASNVESSSVMSGGSTRTKRIASPKMRHVRALSPYSRWQAQGEPGLSDQKSFLSNYAIGNQAGVSTDPETLQKLKDQHMAVNRIEENQKLINQSIHQQRADFKQKLDMIRSMQQQKKDAAGDQPMQVQVSQSAINNPSLSAPIAKPGQDDDQDATMDEDLACNQIPLSNFKSNNLKERQKFLLPLGAMSPGGAARMDEPLSPGAGFAMRTNFKRIANSNDGWGDQLSPRSDSGFAHCICGLPMRPDQETCDQCEGKDSIHIEGVIIKKQKKEGQMRKYWYVLLGMELYSYKNQGDQKHKDMQSLAGVFIKSQAEEKSEDGTVLWPFMLIFPNKRRIYYLEKKEERDQWVEKIKKAIGYANLHDFYDLKESLGKGKYGLVKRGEHKKSGKEVAVKIVKKKELSLKDMELLKREIEVLKVCQHPNIIRFYDVFENSDFIYIVMEYLKGGDFFNYLESKNFKITEDRARTIAHQIATAIYYLHSFGIAHRDLKPENILLVDKSSDSQVKLVDFGLSKTFGPGETSSEPFGTLCYVAPEILLQKPYDKSVDCWSLGIIIYLMLSRHLPFDSNDDKEIGRKTIYQQIQFTHSIWDNVSAEAKDIIFKLLIKTKDERLTIKDALDHPWFNANNDEIQEMRKSANSGDDDVLKFITYSNADVKLAKESAKRSHGDSSPKGNIQVGAILEKGFGGLQHGPGSGNLPNIVKLSLENSNQRPNEQDHEMQM